MKKILTLTLIYIFAGSVYAARTPKPVEVDSLGRKIKTGWNFGILPSVAYDADYGFQGGVLGNIYFYGDGHQYPEYIHSLYVEAAYSTKHQGCFRVNYDSKYLIPGHRITLDALYLPAGMCDFYGFNGYQSVYNKNWNTWNKNPAKMTDPESYRSRLFYKYKRDLIRVAADFEGTIYQNLKWNGGIGVLGYLVSDCNVNMLNGKKVYDKTLKRYEQKALDPQMEGLYDKYIRWGLIDAAEQRGGWHPYLRGGISYDTRDRRQGPTKGIYTDLFFTYSAAFNAAYGQQAAAGYNHLQFNFTFRHYVPVYKDRVTFAYRIGTQNLIAGRSPFYMNSYLNTQFIQRMIYEGLGGGNSLRGVMAYRIMADGFLYGTAEFRCRVVNFDIGRQHFFIGLNPFFDFGMVTQPCAINKINEDELKAKIEADGEQLSDYFRLDKKSIYRPHMAAGLGIKVGMNENFVLSVDWAMPFDKQDNPKWANFYVKMGYLF